MAKKISGSVGKGGKNKSEDTLVVQELLNAFAKKCGFKKLDTDGLVGPKTILAIASFQKNAVGMSRVDSRIDPGGKSFTTLAMGPKKAEAEAKKAEKSSSDSKDAVKGSGGSSKNNKGSRNGDNSAGAASQGKAQVKGDTRGVDKRILRVLEAVSAHYNKAIVIEAGKMSPQDTVDGETIWHDWLNKLDRGERIPSLKRDKRLRKQLDELYNQVQKDKFLAFLAKGSKQFTGSAAEAHATGRAVDIKRNTDSRVVAALATILRREDEGNVIHFDDTGKSVPKTISEDMKKKWK